MNDVYSIVKGIILAGYNMIRLPQGYKAEDASGAAARMILAESGQGSGKHQGHGRFAPEKCTATSYHKKGSKGTVLLTFLDKSARKDDGSFDYRSFTIADLLDPDRNLPYLEVCKNFSNWEKINLKGLPIFPAVEGGAAEAELADGILELRRLGNLIEIFDARVNALKDKVRKSGGGKVTAPDGSSIEYFAPTGTTERIVTAATGESPESQKREVWRVQLNAIVTSNLEKEYSEWATVFRKKLTLRNEVELLPLYMAELESLRERYVSLSQIIRPFELGIIERAEGGTLPENVTIDGEVFEIEALSVDEYDLPADVAERLASGELVKKEVPKVKGKWVLTPAPVPQDA